MRVEARRGHAGRGDKKNVIDFLGRDFAARQQAANGVFTKLQSVREIKPVFFGKRMVALEPFRRHTRISPVDFGVGKDRQQPVNVLERIGKQAAHDFSGLALLDDVLRNHRLDRNNSGHE